jgi:aspartate kinase
MARLSGCAEFEKTQTRSDRMLGFRWWDYLVKLANPPHLLGFAFAGRVGSFAEQKSHHRMKQIKKQFGTFIIMALYIQKFGGTSVANLDCIQRVAERVIKTKEAGHQVVVVVSAMSGETNKLVELAAKITEDPCPREYDVLLTTGELTTIALLSMLLKKHACEAKSYTANQVRIFTDGVHRNAHVLGIEVENIERDLASGLIPVVAGFQGISPTGDITSLGRGGSDATAVALAAALQAKECQIFTDVDGVFNADPRIVSEAKLLPEVSYDEMLQMASLGAKVLQNHAVELAVQNNVPLRVRSTFSDHSGTLLCHHVARMKSEPVTGIVSKRDAALLKISDLSSDLNVLSCISSALDEKGISVDMMIGAENGSLALAVSEDEAVLAKMALLNAFDDEITISTNVDVAQISIVGRGLLSRRGIFTTAFKALADKGVELSMLTSSEIKISAIIDHKKLELSVQELHNAFGLSQE